MWHPQDFEIDELARAMIKVIEELYPRHKQSQPALSIVIQRNKLTRFDSGKVCKAIADQYAEDPEGSRPNWTKVVSRLHQINPHASDPLTKLLTQLRISWAEAAKNSPKKTMRFANVHEWDDEQVWMEYIEARTWHARSLPDRPCTLPHFAEDLETKEPCGLTAGECLANRIECGIINDMLEDLCTLRITPPPWLKMRGGNFVEAEAEPQKGHSEKLF